jgi:hypothetical protein
VALYSPRNTRRDRTYFLSNDLTLEPGLIAFLYLRLGASCCHFMLSILGLTGHLIFLILFCIWVINWPNYLLNYVLPILAPQGDGYVKEETLARE